jgi:hypothetical protein
MRVITSGNAEYCVLTSVVVVLVLGSACTVNLYVPVMQLDLCVIRNINTLCLLPFINEIWNYILWQLCR